MTRALRTRVTIEEGGKIAIQSDDLTPGQSVEVIVLVDEQSRDGNNASFFGSGRGAYPSPEAADEHLRRERDAWQR